MKLLIIRPLPAADVTARSARSAGLDATIMPLFEIAPTRWAAPSIDNFDGIFFSSANALRHGDDMLKNYLDLPSVAVGDVTAAAARSAGFGVALTGNEGKAAILAEARRAGFERLLWLAGKHTAAAAPDEDIIAQRICVYTAREIAPPGDFTAQLSRCDAALLHSPRAAGYFRQMLDNYDIAPAAVSIAAISSEVADAAGAGWKGIAVADRPGDDALLQAALTLLT